MIKQSSTKAQPKTSERPNRKRLDAKNLASWIMAAPSGSRQVLDNPLEIKSGRVLKPPHNHGTAVTDSSDQEEPFHYAGAGRKGRPGASRKETEEI